MFIGDENVYERAAGLNPEVNGGYYYQIKQSLTSLLRLTGYGTRSSVVFPSKYKYMEVHASDERISKTVFFF